MSNFQHDSMRMPTVGSNDQLARSTVTGANVFSKMKPARLPGTRLPEETPLAKRLTAGNVMTRSLQLQTPMKEGNEKPFYGRTGALYKPEFGPVVSKVPVSTPVKGSPTTPFPKMPEQRQFGPKTAESIHMNNFDELPALTRGFAKRASELGWTTEKTLQAFDKIASMEEFAEEFSPAAREKVAGFVGELFKPKNWNTAWQATKSLAKGVGPAVKTWGDDVGSRAGSWLRQPAGEAFKGRNLNPLYNPTAARGSRMAGGSGMQQFGSGVWNSRAMHGLGGYVGGSAIGMGVDALEDYTGYDSGVNWGEVGGYAGGLGRFAGGRKGVARLLPKSPVFQAPANMAGQMYQGAGKFKNISNNAQLAGAGLGTLGAVDSYARSAVEDYGRQKGEEAFRGSADALAQSMGFNDAVSAAASPLGQAIFGFNSGGLTGGAQGLYNGVMNGPTVANGQTQLANGLNSDEIWAGMSQLMRNMQQQGVPQEQQGSVLSQLLSSFSSKPPELERQLG